MRNAAFFTYLLTEAGFDPRTAEQDVCRMEHMISENSFRRLKQSICKKEYRVEGRLFIVCVI